MATGLVNEQDRVEYIKVEVGSYVDPSVQVRDA